MLNTLPLPSPLPSPRKQKQHNAQLLSADHSTLNPHPSSVTSEGNPFNRRWAYYHEMCRTPGGLFIYDLTEAAPLPLLLFGAGQRDPGERYMMRGRQGGEGERQSVLCVRQALCETGRQAGREDMRVTT